MVQATFLLGVGCQKGGTSWLHSWLATSPQCEPGFTKEFHVWDSLDLASERWMRARILDRAARQEQRMREGRSVRVPRAIRQAAFLADPTSYFDYFTSLLRRDGARLAMDVTPSYALLPAARLASIDSEFAARGVRVVPVFLMRDPVERVWSMVRMNQQRQPDRFPGSDADWVARLYADPGHSLRTRYDLTLARLDEAFGHRAWVGFYEELFTEPVLRSITAALGIDWVEPDLDTVVNPAPKGAGLPEELVAEVAGHFRDVYDAVGARFGEERVRRLWPSARALG